MGSLQVLENKPEQGLKNQCPLTECGLLHFYFDWPHQLHEALELCLPPPAGTHVTDILICLVGCYTISSR